MRRFLLPLLALASAGPPLLAQKNPALHDTTAYTTTAISLRAAPRPTAPVYARLAAGTQVHVERCAAGWCNITTQRLAGYLLEEFLTLDQPQATAPGRGYINSDGEWVPSPAWTADGQPPPGASAQCRDGSYSFSRHRQGTCSHHGGVATWLTPESANNRPPTADTGRSVAPALPSCGGACGVERWAVKTLSDADRERVRLHDTVTTTVEELVAIARPRILSPRSRAAPVELTVYRVEGRLLWLFTENDQDYHLVLSSLRDSTITMIAEVPDPGCAGACASGFADVYARVRQKLLDYLNSPRSSARPLVQITGVGFFDFIHGQRGVAPNGIELHPVLDVEFR